MWCNVEQDLVASPPFSAPRLLQYRYTGSETQQNGEDETRALPEIPREQLYTEGAPK